MAESGTFLGLDRDTRRSSPHEAIYRSLLRSDVAACWGGAADVHVRKRRRQMRLSNKPQRLNEVDGDTSLRGISACLGRSGTARSSQPRDRAVPVTIGKRELLRHTRANDTCGAPGDKSLGRQQPLYQVAHVCLVRTRRRLVATVTLDLPAHRPTALVQGQVAIVSARRGPGQATGDACPQALLRSPPTLQSLLRCDPRESHGSAAATQNTNGLVLRSSARESNATSSRTLPSATTSCAFCAASIISVKDR